MGRAFNSGARHFGFEFLRSYERARLFQNLPFEEEGDVVDASGAAENVATVLAVLAPPVEGGIERRFPGRIVGNFVVDEKVNHDGGRPSLSYPKNVAPNAGKMQGQGSQGNGHTRKEMVGTARFEPATPCTPSKCESAARRARQVEQRQTTVYPSELSVDRSVDSSVFGIERS